MRVIALMGSLARVIGIVASLCILTGCSSSNSSKTVDYVLCWLRPSCLPSSIPPEAPVHRAQDSEPVKTLGRPQSVREHTAEDSSLAHPPLRIREAGQRLAGDCHAMAWAEIEPNQETLTIRYQEPTTQHDGSPLRDLAKTSIYKDVGAGFVKIIDVPASNPAGGGIVEETIPLDAHMKQMRRFKICVTATDRHGLEN
ncbi:MAG: hypothetical protein D6690_02085 [Nitrospirae bacterium]|nr:MAG: hypothetical protein D6690_02085 [Nitrospirota bacterium]